MSKVISKPHYTLTFCISETNGLMQLGENNVRVLVNIMKSIDTQKGKLIPMQAWTDPAVSKSWRPPDFKTVGT